jgi:predicted metal-dependent phosphotriesterase family hydrolase
LISQMIQKGFLERILLSLDTTAGRFHYYGGETGLDYLLASFLPMMQTAGLTDSQCRQMTRDNPALALRRTG